MKQDRIVRNQEGVLFINKHANLIHTIIITFLLSCQILYPYMCACMRVCACVCVRMPVWVCACVRVC